VITLVVLNRIETGGQELTNGTRVRRWRLTIAVGAVAAVVLGLVVTGAAAAEPGQDSIESAQVWFDVVTSNHSGVPCATAPTERHVVVRGHLTGPSAKLHNGVDGTLYSHGDGYGEFFWRYTEDRRYNYVADLADRGHVSVTIDRLGYGDSDSPNGRDICLGTEADVLHQVVGQLRDGTYHGDRTPSFHRVALVGHSVSGIIGDQEAAGFHDIDALGVISSGEVDVTPLLAERTGETQIRCLTAPNGYVALEANAEEFRSDHIYNMDPKIVDQIIKKRTSDACAGTANAGQAVALDPVRNAAITVPVLLLIGTNDAFFQHGRLQAATYRGSGGVTFKEIPETGHAIAFGRTAPRFRDEMHRWLQVNRF